jgi:prepilin-type N-terminal cleavage/methylation domain-containing protein
LHVGLVRNPELGIWNLRKVAAESRTMKMKKLKNHQRGFTLIEMVIAVGIAALITGVITFAIMQTLTVDHRASNHMVAVRQVQQAGDQVSKDALQAQNVTPGGCPNCVVCLNWTDVGGNQTTHRIRYTLEDGQLKREDLGLSATTTVAEYITSAIINPPGSCSFPDCGAYNFTVTAGVGDQSETRVYQIEPRPGS